MKKHNATPKKSKTKNLPATQPPKQPINHMWVVMSSLYKYQLQQIGGPKDNPLAESSTTFVADMMVRFKPRDPVEELLMSQMLFTHGRIAYLSACANQQTNMKWAAMMHEALDRAANTFRRQMLALAEYRRPPKTSSFTAIGQANIASQQVVQNGKSKNEKASNEQGCIGDTNGRKALSSDTEGVAGVEGVGSARSAVAVERRTEDGGR